MRLVKAGDFDVEYLDTGTGPAVILLHSSASGLRQWKRLIDELRGSHRVLAVNLFGYGATSPWTAGKMQTLADQAALVVAVAAEVRGPVTLVGHSLGGAVGLEAALRLGERLQAAVVFEPILFSLLKTHGPADAFAEIHTIATRYNALGTAGEWDHAGEWFVDYWSGAGAWASMSDERKAGLRVMLPNVLHEWDAVITPSRALDDWGRIAAPVHILRASDTRRPTHAIASLLTETHSNWRLRELDQGGHMAPVARPDLVNPLIAKILTEVMP
jgi:pimeloyl-ACP methyl ester carboxylesterase